MKKLISGFPDSKGTVGLICMVTVCLTTGFVHAPFPRWTLGEVIKIDPQQRTLVIQKDGSKKTLSLRWNKETRLWIEPTRRHDRGTAFDPKSLTLGAPVRVMFKKYSDPGLVARIIRLSPSGAEFPVAPNKK